MNRNLPAINSGYKTLTIDNIREETRNFKVFTFVNDHDLEYQAGQFITLVNHSGSSEIRRSYSITSSPALKEPLSIAVKRIDNGIFSRNLVDHARKGDRLLTTGVGGFFRLPENINSYTGIFFFAAGSGIAPVLSLLKTVLYLKPKISIFLIYSNQSVATTAFFHELKELEKKFPHQLRIDFLYSSESDLKRARLNRELLLEFLTIDRSDREKTIFYTCGPEAYMRMIIFLLIEEGFPKENIRKEDFNPGNKKPGTRVPPDRNTHMVHLEFNGSYYDFPVRYPDSILQAAKKIKLNLPYSCETGKCGSCAALCKSGKVWLSYNEVLTDKDLMQGLTLTCTGHPQQGDVLLEIR
ncbi:MAG: iron-sulfur cluster-binding domain-containing protein [Bacteroidota bacterium]|nr:iron-sulfur cluster-binding domain-containing protein [Bacteroidota bacterium]